MLLQAIIMAKIKPTIYRETFTSETNLTGMNTLLQFLLDDACSNYLYNYYLDCLDTPLDCNTSSDVSFFNISNNIVEVGNLYMEELPEFSTTRSNMIKILNDWHSIWKQQPPYIKITMDDQQNVTFAPLIEL